ncbi:MAG TPA: alcohol dehydrogenase catalytic domain-containing protein, partial [Sphingomicrobium sp.]
MTSLPPSMRAVIAKGGGELAIVERTLPKPVSGEVLVKVDAAGVNRPDVLQSKGLYPPPPGAPDILGLEIAGKIVAAGEGSKVLIGQQVCALVAGGGYAEYCAAPVGTCLSVPDSI